MKEKKREGEERWVRGCGGGRREYKEINEERGRVWITGRKEKREKERKEGIS